MVSVNNFNRELSVLLVVILLIFFTVFTFIYFVTQNPEKGFRVVCIDNVNYVYADKKMSVKYNSDGTISTCNIK